MYFPWGRSGTSHRTYLKVCGDRFLLSQERLPDGGEGLVEVGDDVGGVLEAY